MSQKDFKLECFFHQRDNQVCYEKIAKCSLEKEKMKKSSKKSSKN